MRGSTFCWICFCLLILPGARVSAGSHLWRINEVFSNADGSIQFVELHECCGAASELFLRGLRFTSEATGSVFTFPENLTESTSQKFLLLATTAFAALPGAPEPDYMIPSNFLSVKGDKLWYSEARNYDSFEFGPGDLPLDGTSSIQRVNFASDEFKTGANTPTNFSGRTATVEASPTRFTRGDCNNDRDSNITDAVFLLGALFRDPVSLSCQDTCDANDDGGLDISDAISILLVLFIDPTPLPPPVTCDVDRTPDPLGCNSFADCP